MARQIKLIEDYAIVLENQKLTETTFQLKLSSPKIAVNTKPGHFVNVEVPGLGGFNWKKPFSIADTDNEDYITLIIKKFGERTEILERNAEAGSKLKIMGPCGSPLPELKGKNKKILLVGGGVGVVPLMAFAKQMRVFLGTDRNRVEKIDLVFGVKSKEDFFSAGEDYVCSDDGSVGEKMNLVDMTKKIMSENKYDLVISCAPKIVLKLISGFIPAEIDYWVLLEENMACGYGACFGCVQKIKADNPEGFKMVRVCKEGPYMDGKIILWD